ncbi:hypothetical protein FQR65_LT20013 [Abscondita terminalis]|nr:hypothetical protein FQR65_LT20013 [Abscondita terminalis]
MESVSRDVRGERRSPDETGQYGDPEHVVLARAGRSEDPADAGQAARGEMERVEASTDPDSDASSFGGSGSSGVSVGDDESFVLADGWFPDSGACFTE